MARSNKILIAAGALGTAAAVGFLMQGGTAQVAAPIAPIEPVAEVTLNVAEADHVAEPMRDDALELSAVTLTSSLPIESDGPRALSTPPAAARLDLSGATSNALPDADRFDEECPVTMSAENSIAALVNLSFQSKCDPYARVTFEHEGMKFSENADSMGRVEITVPALAEDAKFTALLNGGEAAVAKTTVSSLVFYDRAVLQTTGRSGVELHALEYTTDYTAPGHVSPASPADPTVAARGEGGFLLILGDSALSEGSMAQVYTFPTATAKKPGDIQLSVEAEVLRETCDREVSATVLQVNAGERVNEQDLTITVPSCDAVGDYLLLKTPLNDLKIASK